MPETTSTSRFQFETGATGLLSSLLVPISDTERRTFSSGSPGWFHKELIRESLYIHPVYGWKMNVSESDLRAWAKAFGEMMANGVKVPVPDGHVWTALDNQGFTREMYVAKNEDGTWSLYAWMEIVSQAAVDGIRDGSIDHVSIAVGQDVKDGLGNEYGSAIEHVCLTNYPVAHNTGDFAEGRFSVKDADGGQRDVFVFSRDGDWKTLAVSTAPWVLADNLPPSCYLSVGDEKDAGTWRWPVYEAGGPTEDMGGRTVHTVRGSLNANAVQAAAESLVGATALDTGLRKTVAVKLVGLFHQCGKVPPSSLVNLTGERLDASRTEPNAGPGGSEPKESEPMNPKLLSLCKLLGIQVDKPDEEPSPEFLATVFAKAEEAALKVPGLEETIATLTKKVETKDEDEATRFAKKAETDPDFAKVLAAKDAAEKTAADDRAENRKALLTSVNEEVEALAANGTLAGKAVDAAKKLLGVLVRTCSFSFAKDGKDVESEDLDVAETVRELLAALPEGASLDPKERTARKAGSRTLSTVESQREQENAQEKADILATEDLMSTGQPIPGYLLTRLPEKERERAKAHNENLDAPR